MYFDYLATTPLDDRVLQAMQPYWTVAFGNPHSHDHAYGMEAKQAVERARAGLDTLLPRALRNTGRWVFTSGATEANNLVLKGLAEADTFPAPAGRRRILISAIEHACVLQSAAWLSRRGYIVEQLPVTNDGVLDLDELVAKLSDDVLLVSVMWANNETGVVQPVADIARLCRAHGALFHSDAAQAAGKIPLELPYSLFPDFITLSAHKLYGPKGIGALYATGNNTDKLSPQIHGGGQQDGLRAGTLPMPLIAGMGAAAEIAVRECGGDGLRLQALRNSFERHLTGAFPDLRVNGATAPRLPHVSHIQIPGVEMGDLLSALPEIAVSRGSACGGHAGKVSHVMAAMRMEFFAHECLRISFGRPTTPGDVEALTSLLIETATNIRDYTGFSAQNR